MSSQRLQSSRGSQASTPSFKSTKSTQSPTQSQRQREMIYRKWQMTLKENKKFENLKK